MNPNQDQPGQDPAYGQPVVSPSPVPGVPAGVPEQPAAPFTPPSSPTPLTQPYAQPSVPPSPVPTTPVPVYGAVPGVVSPSPVIGDQPVVSGAVPPVQPAPIYGQPPQPVAAQSYQAYQAVDPPKSKFAVLKSKLSIVFVVLAVLASGAIWAVNHGIFSKGTPLTTYEGQGYSILVPEDYKKDTADPQNVSFTHPNAKSDEAASAVNIVSRSGIADYKSELKTSFKEEYTEDKLKELVSPATVKSYDSKDKTINGLEAQVVKADIEEKDGDTVRKAQIVYAVIYGSDDLYVVSILANGNDHGLSKQVDTIVESFKQK